MMDKLSAEFAKAFSGFNKDVFGMILYAAIAVFFAIIFCLSPLTSQIIIVAVFLAAMTLLFAITYLRAKEWKASEYAIKVSAYLIFEFTILGGVASFWLLTRDLPPLMVLCLALAYLGLGFAFTIILYGYTKKVDPKIVAAQEAEGEQERRRQAEFAKLVAAANEGLQLTRAVAERMPQINERFFELSSRVEAIEGRFLAIMQNREAAERELLDSLAAHNKTNMIAMGQMQADMLDSLKAEKERFRNETEAIVGAMAESFNSITASIEHSFAPFNDSIRILENVDSITASAINKLSEAAQTFVKISEPQAELASGAADLIKEAMHNINLIANQSLSIISLALNSKIEEAVKELKNQ